MNIPHKTRARVLARDDYSCVRCGQSVLRIAYSLHHRRPRGMGGSRDARINQPANLLTLCGHATSPDGCHLRVEADRLDAKASGYLLNHVADAEATPVLTHLGSFLFLNDFTKEAA